MADGHYQVRPDSDLGSPKHKRISLNDHSQMNEKRKLTKIVSGKNKLALIEGSIEEGTSLYYIVKKEIKGEGIFKDGGIFCLCCHKQVTPTQFEKHAGFASRKNAYNHIFTPLGESLEDMAIRLSEKYQGTFKQDGEQCAECFETEDLFLCKKCRRAFHAECVGMSGIPAKTWSCTHCYNMQDHSRNSFEARQVKRSIYNIDMLKHDDIGRCAICSWNDFTVEIFNDRTVVICDQCEREYHVGCLREKKIVNLKDIPKDDWFCTKQCRNIYTALSMLIEDGEQSLPGNILYVLNKKFEEKALDQNQLHKIRWRLLRGKDAHKYGRKLLISVVSILRNQFGPIYDSSIARSDLIPYIVHGKQFGGQDYSGMYCAILMAKSVVVSTALFRIFGEELAEIPLVATKKGFERKGYFQSLFFCLENLLGSQNVKNLVLHAITKEKSIWKYKFWFDELNDEQVHGYKENHYQIMALEGTSTMHKLIPNSNAYNESGRASNVLS